MAMAISRDAEGTTGQGIDERSVSTQSPSTGQTGSENAETVYRELMAGKSITIETMKAIEAEMTRRTGAKLLYNGDGTKADWQLPNGAVIDSVLNFGGPVEGRQLAWNVDAPGGGGPGGFGPGGLPPGYTIGTMTGGGEYPLAAVGGPGLMQPWTTPFQAPTVTDDPGFKFRMEQGQQALERSAAARGTLLSGGTLKDLAQYSQGLGSQEYGNAYNRRMGEYMNAYNIYNTNQGNAYNRLFGMSNMGASAAGGIGSLGSGYANAAGNLYTGQGNATAAGQVGSSNAWNNVYSTIGDIVGGVAAGRTSDPTGSTPPYFEPGTQGAPPPPSTYVPYTGLFR